MCVCAWVFGLAGRISEFRILVMGPGQLERNANNVLLAGDAERGPMFKV